MTRLLAHEHVRCPSGLLDRYVASYLESQRRADGTVHLKLGVPSRTLDHVGLSLEREVIAQVAFGPDPSGLNRVLNIGWEPEGGGPYPSFSGMLNAEPIDGSEDDSLLVLDGSYEPPGGGPGRVFDEAIGFSIARSSARALLEQLRDDAEAAYRNESTRSG
jgi:hypothetical protein